MIEIDEVRPIHTSQSGDIDGSTQIDLYERHKLEISLRKLLEVNYRVHSNQSRNHPSAPEAMRYTGSGYWSKWRDDTGALVIHFDVGCWCAHDTCGHLCGLRITVQQTEQHFIIIIDKQFNC